MIVLNDPQLMLERRFDFTISLEEKIKSYVIATTQRSGSTKLCLDLWQKGSFGAPWEYFNIPHMMPMFRRLETHNLADYYKALIKIRTSPNGVFGHKMFVSTFAVADFAGEGVADALVPPRIVFLRRRDKIAQARSLVTATDRQRWVGSGRPETAERITPERLRAAFRYIGWQEAVWEKHFRDRNLDPLRIWHEDHIRAPHDTIAAIAGLLDIAPGETATDIPQTIVQAASPERDDAGFDLAAAVLEPFTIEELNQFVRTVRFGV